MSFFSIKRKYRISAAFDVFVPQIYSNGYWSNITPKLDVWSNPASGIEYCSVATKEDAQRIVDAYKALVDD